MWVLACVSVLVLTCCSHGVPEKQAVVDAFPAPSDWEVITHPNYSGEFRQGLCIGTFDCRVQVAIQWKVPIRPSPATLTTLAEDAGWQGIRLDDSCDDDSRYCSLRAESGGINVRLSYRPEGTWRIISLAAG